MLKKVKVKVNYFLRISLNHPSGFWLTVPLSTILGTILPVTNFQLSQVFHEVFVYTIDPLFLRYSFCSRSLHIFIAYSFYHSFFVISCNMPSCLNLPDFMTLKMVLLPNISISSLLVLILQVFCSQSITLTSSILRSKYSNLFYCLLVRDQVSLLYISTGRIVVLLRRCFVDLFSSELLKRIFSAKEHLFPWVILIFI